MEEDWERGRTRLRLLTFVFRLPYSFPVLRQQHRLAPLEDSSKVMPYCTGKFALLCYLRGVHLCHSFKQIGSPSVRCKLEEVSIYLSERTTEPPPVLYKFVCTLCILTSVNVHLEKAYTSRGGRMRQSLCVCFQLSTEISFFPRCSTPIF